jgi:photosystem II stability/assembly factor-like uncharacterized protein
VTIYRSTDDAQTWTQITVQNVAGVSHIDRYHGLEEISTGTLFCAVYAADGQTRLYRSTDDGRTWAQVFAIPIDEGNIWQRNIRGLLELRDRSALLLSVANHAGPPRQYVYRSTNDGQTWTLVLNTAAPSGGDLNSPVRTALADLAGRVWLIRRYRSDDGGQTWIDTGLPASGGAVATAGSILFAGGDGAFGLRSTDGLTWAATGPVGSLYNDFGFMYPKEARSKMRRLRH